VDQHEISSSTFGNHQKNAGGDALIANMFGTYFKSPKSFVEQLYLSQVQQAFAIRMGSEFWRTTRTRGILYWQLNDCWPASSWSSIEYGGRWKQLHYHAKRFFAPLLVTFHESQGLLRLWIVNDKITDVILGGKVQWIHFNGTIGQEWEIGERTIQSDRALEVWEVEMTRFDRASGFFFATVADEFTNFFFPARFKDCALEPADIVAVVAAAEGGSRITLTTDKPAFFVHLECDRVNRFSDSSFVLLPGQIKVVTCEETITPDELTVYQLNTVGVD
jgi:beta-mannosidase